MGSFPQGSGLNLKKILENPPRNISLRGLKSPKKPPDHQIALDGQLLVVQAARAHSQSIPCHRGCRISHPATVGPLVGTGTTPKVRLVTRTKKLLLKCIYIYNYTYIFFSWRILVRVNKKHLNLNIESK